MLRVSLLMEGVAGLPDEWINELVAVTSAELEIRVGERLVSTLTSAQFEFIKVRVDDGGDDVWGSVLDEYCPDHPSVVAEESDRIVREVARRCAAHVEPPRLIRFSCASRDTP